MSNTRMHNGTQIKSKGSIAGRKTITMSNMEIHKLLKPLTCLSDNNHENVCLKNSECMYKSIIN